MEYPKFVDFRVVDLGDRITVTPVRKVGKVRMHGSTAVVNKTDTDAERTEKIEALLAAEGLVKAVTT